MKQSEPIVNFEELLAPISEARPTGIDLREDDSPTSAYFQLKDARNAARADERNQASLPEAERTESKHWGTILELAPRILKEQSKDLEVAAWYTEALLRKHALAGFCDGLKLLFELITNFWEGLYPTEDEDGVATKIAPLVGLFGLSNAGSIIQPLNCVNITDPKQEPHYALWQYQQAQSLARAPDAKTRNKRIESGVPTLEALEKAAQKTSAAFYHNFVELLEEVQKNYTELFAQLDTLCGESAPNSSFLRTTLSNFDAAIAVIAKHVLKDTESAALAEPGLTDTAEDYAQVTTAGNLSATTIKQRSEAFATIQVIADFFRKTEPHSPISYALERVVKWGDMQLPELLKELVEDKIAFDAYCKLTGIEIPKPTAPGFPSGAPMGMGGYHDPMGQSSMSHNPMGMGGYPPPPAPGGPMGNSMFNDTF